MIMPGYVPKLTAKAGITYTLDYGANNFTILHGYWATTKANNRAVDHL